MRLRSKLLLLFGSIAVAFGAGEAYFRSLNHPLLDVRKASLDEPRIFEPDPVLGWKSKPGRYTYRYDVWGGKRIEIEANVGKGGERLHPRSAPTGAQPLPEIAVAGDSLVFGWGVNDADTLPALLAERLPSFRVVNLGTGGYGTGQTLLALERRYEGRPPPALAVIGFCSFHEERNVASPAWRLLLYTMSERGHVDLPYVTLDPSGALQWHAPERVYPLLPWMSWSRMLTCANLAIEQKRFQNRGTSPQAATLALLERAREFGRSHGCPVLIAYLDDAKRGVYVPALDRLGLEYVLAGPMISLGYDPHPSPEFHRQVADPLAERIRLLLRL